MAGRDIIVVGASAGGVEALGQLVAGLPPGLPAAFFIVCHFPAGGLSHLPEILSRRGPLLAHHARDGEPIYPAHMYVAPPDYHLIVEPGAVRLDHGPRENRFRPSIDPLFRSAARAYGPRVIAVLLSGALNDGVAGLLAVRAAGGLAVLQDPTDAFLPDLPQTARAIAGADHVATAQHLGPLLSRLVHDQSAVPGGSRMADPVTTIAQKVEHDMAAQSRDARRGTVSVFTCPECGGAMWQLDEKELVRFRCHVGHAYEAEALLQEQASVLEAALWTAVRTFREKSVLTRQLATREREAGNAVSAGRFEGEARQLEQYGDLIRDLLVRGMHAAPPEAPAS